MSDLSAASAKLCSALSAVLRETREAADLSLGEVARRSGLNRQAISFIEKGQRQPTADTMAKLSLALGLLPSEIWRRAEKITKIRTKPDA